MTITPFEKVRESLSLGLSRFAEGLLILLRAGLLLLFIWYGVELFCTSTDSGAKWFLGLLGIFLLLTLVIVTWCTYNELVKPDHVALPSRPIPLWPFVLINLLMILVVSAIGKWERDCGATGVTSGLLGFTQHWVRKIGTLFTGG